MEVYGSVWKYAQIWTSDHLSNRWPERKRPYSLFIVFFNGHWLHIKELQKSWFCSWTIQCFYNYHQSNPRIRISQQLAIANIQNTSAKPLNRRTVEQYFQKASDNLPQISNVYRFSPPGADRRKPSFSKMTPNNNHCCFRTQSPVLQWTATLIPSHLWGSTFAYVYMLILGAR